MDLFSEQEVQEEERASQDYLDLAEETNYECDGHLEDDLDIPEAQMTEIQIELPSRQRKLKQREITSFFSKK